MTPVEAVQLLDGMIAQMQMNRQSHAACIDAVQTLGRFINEHTDHAAGPKLVPDAAKPVE